MHSAFGAGDRMNLVDDDRTNGREHATTTHRLAGVLPVHLQPDLVCLNFQAWNNTAIRIGGTFTVQYTLDYRVFKDSVLSAAQR